MSQDPQKNPTAAGNATAANQTSQITQETAINTVTGTQADAANTTGTTGTLSGKLRGLVSILADVWNSTSHFLGISKVTLDAGENQPRDRQQVEEPCSTTNITTATTTTVLTGAGTLQKIIINKAVAAGVITIYDNTAASGTKLGTITFGATLLNDPPLEWAPKSAIIATGITIVTSAATDLTVCYDATS